MRQLDPRVAVAARRGSQRALEYELLGVQPLHLVLRVSHLPRLR
jgi:hypothetical protein